MADDADNYLPENDEQPTKPPAPKPAASPAANPSRLEVVQLEDVTFDDKRALTPSSPIDLDTTI